MTFTLPTLRAYRAAPYAQTARPTLLGTNAASVLSDGHSFLGAITYANLVAALNETTNLPRLTSQRWRRNNGKEKPKKILGRRWKHQRPIPISRSLASSSSCASCNSESRVNENRRALPTASALRGRRRVCSRTSIISFPANTSTARAHMVLTYDLDIYIHRSGLGPSSACAEWLEIVRVCRDLRTITAPARQELDAARSTNLNNVRAWLSS